MIGKTNVNERNTRYRVGAVEIDALGEYTLHPADRQLDYFDEVNVTLTGTHAFKDLCNGVPVNFTPAEVSGITRVIDYFMYKIPYLGVVDIPSTVTYIGTYAFFETALTSLRVDTPLVTMVGNNAFGNLRSMTTAYINLPLVTSNNNFLNGANSLTHLDLVAIGAMGEYFLYGAPKLPYLEIPAMCTNIGTRSFDLSVSDNRNSVPIHIVFNRHVSVDEQGNYVVAPPTLSNNLFGNRTKSKVFLHVPLDSLLPYRRQMSLSGVDNAGAMARIFTYVDAVVGDTLPTSLTQQAAGYQGSYTIAWYTDQTHETAYAGSTADQAGRYYGVVTVVSETAI